MGLSDAKSYFKEINNVTTLPNNQCDNKDIHMKIFIRKFLFSCTDFSMIKVKTESGNEAHIAAPSPSCPAKTPNW